MPSVGYYVIELQVVHPIMRGTGCRRRIVDFYAKEKGAVAITFFRVLLPFLTWVLSIDIAGALVYFCVTVVRWR